MIVLLLSIIVVMMMAQWFPGVLNFISWVFVLSLAAFVLFVALG
jgi:hypothetical protein